MGQGGSATSGQGLTGMQVAAALRVTAAAQLEQFRSEQAGGAGGAHELPPDAYGATRCHEVAVGAKDTARVTEYAPDVFRCIRTADDIAEDLFAEEWTLPEERLKMELGEGRSQALFLKSKNLEFMCKTIAVDEVEVLMEILKDYAEHIVAHPSSLLMRFYMLLRVQVRGEVGYILCFNDVFGSATTLNEKWDIKGRVPKPGKFQHFPHLVRQAYEPDPHLIDTPHDDRLSATDAPSGGGHGDDVVVVQAPGDKHSLPTHKDKELTRLFWLELPVRERVVGQLLADYAFLRGVGLMDYSMLIGVSYNDTKVSRSGKRYVVIKNMKMQHVLGAEQEAEEVELRPGSPRLRGRRSDAGAESADSAGGGGSDLAGGVHSLFGQEVYYIGVIDMLTRYGGKKKLANFFKSFLWHNNTLSTIPPEAYEARIAHFTKLIFPLVEEKGE